MIKKRNLVIDGFKLNSIVTTVFFFIRLKSRMDKTANKPAYL